MNVAPTYIALLTWVVVFAAALFGMWIGARLPEGQRTSETKDAVTLSMAMVSTLTALVLGLILSVSNDSYRGNQEQLMATSSNLIRMDHLFRFYGPEADSARTFLQKYAASMVSDIFPPAGQAVNIENEATLDLAAQAEDAAARLVPATPTQRWLQPRMFEVAGTIGEEHFALVKQKLDGIPVSLIVLLLVWLVLLFFSYGLFAPRHPTSILVMLMSSFAASGAILLILELETPNDGFVRLSADPLLHAIEVMQRHPVAP